MHKSKLLEQDLSSPERFKIDEVFKSIQTEGPFQGMPASFIRFFGCNLACSFCDTMQTQQTRKQFSKWNLMSLVNTVKDMGTPLVVITGGEPYLYDFSVLANTLLNEGFIVQVETSGSLDVPNLPYDHERFHVVLSPKGNNLAPEVKDKAFAWKYIVKSGCVNEVTGLPEGMPYCLEHNRIMISPQWEKTWKETKSNIDEAVAVCKHFGYKFTLQYHKMIKIP